MHDVNQEVGSLDIPSECVDLNGFLKSAVLQIMRRFIYLELPEPQPRYQPQWKGIWITMEKYRTVEFCVIHTY